MRIENRVSLPGDYHMTIQQGHFATGPSEKNGMDALPNRRLSFPQQPITVVRTLAAVVLHGWGKTAPLVYDRIQTAGGYTDRSRQSITAQFFGCRGMPLNGRESLMEVSAICRTLKQKLHRWSGEEDGRRICLI